MSFPLLITGCGRSGTYYISSILQNVGLDVRHEKPGALGMVSWFNVVEDFPGFNERICPHNTYRTIFHQVRHPLKVIRSWWMLDDPAQRPGLQKYVGYEKDLPREIKWGRYWLYWNQRAETLAEWTYQVEALPAVLSEFCDRLGLSAMGFDRTKKVVEQTPHNLNTNHNARRSPEITFERIRNLDPVLCEQIREQANRYGYSC